MTEIRKLKISGMSCVHCEKTLAKALGKVLGVDSIERVSWENNEAIIRISDGVSQDDLSKQVKKAGYRLEKVSTLSDPGQINENPEFDVVIIGGGSAGFSAAIKAAELGKRAALIESGTIGGTCVNIGCVPSKFIIGEAFSGNSWEKIKADRDKLVAMLQYEKYQNVLESYSGNITYIHETASFINKDSIRLSNGRIITGGKYILTTGSKPQFPEISGISEIDPLDSTGLLFIEELPESLLIVGGRFIALELGQVFSNLGVKVTILQRSSRLIPQYDPIISETIEQIFLSQGIKVITGTKLLSASKKGNKKILRYKVQSEEREVSGDQILFSTGRSGNIESLNLAAAEVKLDSSKHIVTDAFLRTSNPKIFAAGDVLDTPGLVYVAAKEGQTALRNALSKEPHVLDYNAVPEVIFTRPQIARVGVSEKDAVAKNIPVSTTSFSIADTPYGLVNNDKKGVVKLIKNIDSGQLIGAEIIASDAGNMIQSVTIAIKAGMTIEDLIDTYFPYLTAVEGIKLGAIIFGKDVHKLSCCAS
ncbi:MAG TPA: mercury(II) reductase [Spirochaetales bacterium]|nr:mercury(II) reductase [Spirochaetales bacterium]